MKRLSTILLSLAMLVSSSACGRASLKENASSKMPSASIQEGSSKEENPGGFHFETRTVTLNSGYEMPIMGLGT